MQIRVLWLCGGLLASCGFEEQPVFGMTSTAESPRREQPKAAEPQVTTGDPRDALEWRRLAMLDETGRCSPADLKQARSQRKVNVDFAAATPDGGIGKLTWTKRGPDNLGGRSRAILVDPTRRSRLYAACDGGGVWRSDDSGLSWCPAANFGGNLAAACLALDPDNPNVIYAGTGEGDGNGNAIRGEGIWRSCNAGITWQPLASTACWARTSRIAICPTSPNIILAATDAGVRRSTDSGATWTTVQPGDSYQVLIDPNVHTRMLCHYSTKAAGALEAEHRIAYSDDCGATWVNAVGGFPTNTRIELAYAPSVPGLVYASLNGGDCWRSSDAGASWTKRSSGQIDADLWWYCNSIWVDPTDPNWLVIAASTPWRSADGGLTFTKIAGDGTNPDTPQADVHFWASDPCYDGADNRTVYACTDRGIYRTNDIRTASNSSGWSRRNHKFCSAPYYGVAGHSSGRLVGGTQGNGSHVLDDTHQVASRYMDGDGGNSQIDSTNPNFLWGSYQWGNIHRSTDGGISASLMTSGLTERGPHGGGNFIAPLVSSRFNPDILYAGAASLWRCANAKSQAPTWTAIKPSIKSPISAIAIAYNAPQHVWVGHNNGRIFRSSNALTITPTWTEVDPDNHVPNSTITRILLDRNNWAHALVARSGYVGDNLWRTTDNGATFTDVTGAGPSALPSAPIRGITQHPALNGHYYLATEVGVFGSSDDCQTWTGTNEGPADVACYDITFLHGSTTLLVGTHGRGMWTTEIEEPQASSFGAGCAGTNGTPTLTASSPRIGQRCTISGFNMPPNGNVWLVQGNSNLSWNGNLLPFELSSFQAPGCSLRVRPDMVRDGWADAFGTYSAKIQIAASNSLLGTHIYLQAFPGDPKVNGFGRTASNGVDLLIGK